MKPRFGLIRAKEFLMKDLYTFDKDPVAAQHTYEQVSAAYQDFFASLGVPFVRVQGDSGNMGNWTMIFLDFYSTDDRRCISLH